jgi:hypothetical protein
MPTPLPRMNRKAAMQRIGCTRDTIRRFEKKGLLTPEGGSGSRRHGATYTGESVEVAKVIFESLPDRQKFDGKDYYSTPKACELLEVQYATLRKRHLNSQQEDWPKLDGWRLTRHKDGEGYAWWLVGDVDKMVIAQQKASIGEYGDGDDLRYDYIGAKRHFAMDKKAFNKLVNSGTLTVVALPSLGKSSIAPQTLLASDLRDIALIRSKPWDGKLTKEEGRQLVQLKIAADEFDFKPKTLWKYRIFCPYLPDNFLNIMYERRPYGCGRATVCMVDPADIAALRASINKALATQPDRTEWFDAEAVAKHYGVVLCTQESATTNEITLAISLAHILQEFRESYPASAQEVWRTETPRRREWIYRFSHLDAFIRAFGSADEREARPMPGANAKGKPAARFNDPSPAHRVEIHSFGPEAQKQIFEMILKAQAFLSRNNADNPQHSPTGNGTTSASPVITPFGSVVDDMPIVTSLRPTPFQKRMLEALDGQALKGAVLTRKLRCSRSRLYRDGIDPLKAANLIAVDRKIGYFRPDRPPSRETETHSKNGVK